MADFIQNNIHFSATPGGKMNSKISLRANGDFSDIAEGIDPLVNAVEIDWNGAQLGNNYQSKLVKLVVRLIVRTNSIS